MIYLKDLLRFTLQLIYVSAILSECPKPECTGGTCTCHEPCQYYRSNPANSSAGICSQCCGGYYYDVGDCYPCTTCQDGVGPQAECVKDGTSNDCPSHNLDKVVSPSACISLVPTTKAPLTEPCEDMKVECGKSGCQCIGNIGDFLPPCNNLRGHPPSSNYTCWQCPKGHYLDVGDCKKCARKPCATGFGPIADCVLDGDDYQCPEDSGAPSKDSSWHVPVGIACLILAVVGLILAIIFFIRVRRLKEKPPYYQESRDIEFKEDKNGIRDIHAVQWEDEHANPDIDLNAPGYESAEDEHVSLREV